MYDLLTVDLGFSTLGRLGLAGIGVGLGPNSGTFVTGTAGAVGPIAGPIWDCGPGGGPLNGPGVGVGVGRGIGLKGRSAGATGTIGACSGRNVSLAG